MLLIKKEFTFKLKIFQHLETHRDKREVSCEGDVRARCPHPNDVEEHERNRAVMIFLTNDG